MAMVAANFTGAKPRNSVARWARSAPNGQRMREVERKMRAGMTQNGISQKAQDQIIQSIVSFALYGFPESHAASFALIAYASAYLKTHYLAAFTAAILNNQPMGFYHSSTLIKDAQRHGLRVLPVDIVKSEWECTIEKTFSVPRSPFSDEKRGSWFVNGGSKKGVNQEGRTRNEERTENVEPRTENELTLRLGFRYVRGYA